MASLINADTSDGLKLTSDTSGEIKLQSAGADIATVSSTGIAMAAGKTLPAASLTGTLPAIDGSSLTGVGKILQVVSTTKTDTFSTTSTSYVDITGLSVSITPTSTSSKIFILVSISGGNNAGAGYQLVKNSTPICIGVSGGGSRKQSSGEISVRDSNGINNGSITYLDSPATTSATTYKVQMYTPSSTGYVNRTAGDADANYTTRSASSITVMEVAG